MAMTKKYRDDFPQKLVDHMKDGMGFYSFGGLVSAGQTTLETWLKEYPEFAEAKQIGRLKRLQFFEQNQAMGAIGATREATVAGKKVTIKPNPVFSNFIMARAFKDFGYTEKIITEEVGKTSKLVIVMGDEEEEEIKEDGPE